jgi:hypothetical protein
LQRRKTLDPRAAPVARSTATKRGAAASKALLHRAQQWLSARERLVSIWLTRTGQRARLSLQTIASRYDPAGNRHGSARSPVVPRWWEYESELKRRLALEILLRRLFSLVPVQAPEPVQRTIR